MIGRDSIGGCTCGMGNLNEGGALSGALVGDDEGLYQGLPTANVVAQGFASPLAGPWSSHFVTSERTTKAAAAPLSIAIAVAALWLVMGRR